MAERPLGPNPRTFGHFGGGGSLAFADPDAKVGWGYVMNQGRGGWQHRHNTPPARPLLRSDLSA